MKDRRGEETEESNRTGRVKDDSGENRRRKLEEEGQEEARQGEGQAHELVAQDSLPRPQALVRSLGSRQVPRERSVSSSLSFLLLVFVSQAWFVHPFVLLHGVTRIIG